MGEKWETITRQNTSDQLEPGPLTCGDDLRRRSATTLSLPDTEAVIPHVHVDPGSILCLRLSLVGSGPAHPCPTDSNPASSSNPYISTQP